MASKAAKEKKQLAPPLHPPYLTMISEAISSLKERSGSSQPAIAKYLEEKYKTHLPPNFRKMLSVQLKRFAKSEKLFKVKNSYKLSAPATKKPTTNTAAAAPKKKVTTQSAAAKKVVKGKKPKMEEKTKVKKKVILVAPKVKDVEKKKAPKPKAPKPKAKSTPKKTKSLKVVKTTPMKKRTVKSIKSPSKPAAAKKSKK